MGSPQSTRVGDGFYGSRLDFEIERGSPRSGHGRPKRMPSPSDINEHALRTHLALLLAAKSRPFSVSGLIPLDPTNLVVFFRSKVSGSSTIQGSGQVMHQFIAERNYTLSGFSYRRRLRSATCAGRANSRLRSTHR
jgi:hypothetical protein